MGIYKTTEYKTEEFFDEDYFGSGRTNITQYGGAYRILTDEQYREIEKEIGTETDGKRAVGYIRVSTLGQVGENRFGMDEQRDLIQKYCDEHGLKLMGWYIDSGVSGTVESRPAMDALIYGTLKNPAINYVVCAKSDRMARDIKLYYYYLMLLEKKGIELISATEEVVNDSSGMGGIYKSLMLFVAEQERKNITMRTSGGRNQKAKNGGFSGGRTPFGYKSDYGELVIVPEEAEIVKKTFFLYSRGMSAYAIANYLNESGARGRAGTPLAVSTVISILKREKFYRGYYHYGSSGWVKGKHTPIITDESLKVPEDRQVGGTKEFTYPKSMYQMNKDMAIKELEEAFPDRTDGAVITAGTFDK